MIIRGQFHTLPAGTRIWECSICNGHFAWGANSSGYGNIEEMTAVFCSKDCAKKFRPKTMQTKTPVRPQILAKDRVHLEEYM